MSSYRREIWHIGRTRQRATFWNTDLLYLSPNIFYACVNFSLPLPSMGPKISSVYIYTTSGNWLNWMEVRMGGIHAPSTKTFPLREILLTPKSGTLGKFSDLSTKTGGEFLRKHKLTKFSVSSRWCWGSGQSRQQWTLVHRTSVQCVERKSLYCWLVVERKQANSRNWRLLSVLKLYSNSIGADINKSVFHKVARCRVLPIQPLAATFQ